MHKKLLDKQEKHGAEAGSWPEDGMWGKMLGRLGQTFFSLMTLEVGPR